MAPTSLAAWLAGLTAEDLATVLTRRPDVARARPPENLDDLAERLTTRTSVAAAFLPMCQPMVQVIEVLQALDRGDPAGVPRAEVARLLGVAEDAAAFDGTLRALAESALVWPDGDCLQTAPPLRFAFAYPLQLGRPVRELLSGRTVGELRDIASALGLRAGSSKGQLSTAVFGALGDADVLRTLVEQAPESTRRLLHETAHRGPVLGIEGVYFSGYTARLPTELAWPIERGMLVSDGWQLVEMPREVALALRGADWRAPFDPSPPRTTVATVAPEGVARDAAAAAAAALDRFGGLLEACAATPVTLLKAGGIGAREIRRLAKAVNTTPGAVRVWLALAADAGLLEFTDDGAVPTTAFDDWRGAEPPVRLAGLVTGWVGLFGIPVIAGEHGRPALFNGDPDGPIGPRLRTALLTALAELPDGSGQLGPDDGSFPGLDHLVRWHAPLTVGAVDDAELLIEAIWTEAALLGLTGQGALSALGRAAVTGDPARLTEAAATMVAAATQTARFQADLSAIVPGTPGRDLAELLDLCADRETRGTASIWRFSPTSVRRALDSGRSTSDLLDELRAVSSSGTLPQPVEYLFGDVARRHGSLRVREVAAAIRSDDQTLLAELVAAKALRPLGLVALAPTVVVSAKPVAETLRALRAASYAPVQEDATGAIVMERPPRRRSTSTGPRPARRSGPAAVEGEFDPLAVAKALLAAPAAPVRPDGPKSPPRLDRETFERMMSGGPPVTPGLHVDLEAVNPWVEESTETDDLTVLIGLQARHLPADEIRLLAAAIVDNADVAVGYRGAKGVVTTEGIGDIVFTGDRLTAWSHEREVERVFLLSRITAVTPY